MTRALVLLLLICLGGCGAITDPLGMEDPFGIPKPFEGVERNDRMIGQALEMPALVVEAPVGLSEERATALRDEVVRAAHKHDVPALAEATPHAWILRASVEMAPGQGVVTWVISDGTGSERGKFSVTFSGDETALDGAGLQLVAEQTAVNLENALHRPGMQAVEAAAPAAVVQKPIVWVGSVKGAPGDGNKELARALTAILPIKGLRIESAKAKAEWLVDGQVKVAAVSATQDMVTLTWRVYDRKGNEIGTLSQENPVAKGSLSKSWGRVATFAAEAAAEGIAQLIQQVSTPKRS